MGSSRTTEISVVLPFRNAARFLPEALASLQRQDFEDFEVVMVDDGSADEGPSAASRFASDDGRFRLVPSRGRGLVPALNTGLAEASGRWIARLDADDRCHPSRLGRQLDLAGRAGPGFVVGCLVRRFGSSGEGWRLYEQWLNSLTEHGEIERNIFVESPIAHPTAFYDRKSVISEGGYREGPFPEDYELWLRLWSRGYRFVKVPEVLVEWRDSGGRLSRLDPRYGRKSFFGVKASYLPMAPAVRGFDRVIVWGAGLGGKNLADCIRRSGLEVEAFVDISPRRIGGTARGRPVISPEQLGDLRRAGSRLPVLGAVRARGGRESIREALESMGLVEWREFVICC